VERREREGPKLLLNQGPSEPCYATEYYLIGVKAPEFEFLLEERATHVGRVVQLAGPVVVEYLREDARVAVEEVLVEYRVVVCQRFGQPRQPRGRNLLQGGLVRLVSDAAHVENDAVVGVSHRPPADGVQVQDEGRVVCYSIEMTPALAEFSRSTNG